MFTAQDIDQLNSKGIALQQAEEQVNSFVQGFPFLSIDRAARVSDGIVSMTADRIESCAEQWDKITDSKNVTVVKFVPASGAATRMFKEYFEFLDSGEASQAVEAAVQNIENFAFASDLHNASVNMSDSRAVVKAILDDSGLGYGKAPKALIKFHKYSNIGRTALEEHMVEGALYGMSGNGTVKIHFTISPEHMDQFRKVVEQCKDQFEARFATTFDISYSIQKPSTDTLAVDMDNKPFRTEHGELLFRPAGHGALIENLADLDADVIFIKTVDNVQPDHRKSDTVLYKKALAAFGLELQGKIFSVLSGLRLESVSTKEAISFIENNLGYSFGQNVSREHVIEILDRPLRVCGMVRNEGEPGGGPFWVKDGCDKSVQIAESSQISPDQIVLMKEATHFNPVDLVCFTRNQKGEHFDLRKYTDPKTGFISEKSYAGRKLKAQELPGLWNGAMARWNTVFVEVPISTFSPVKVLGDLLRPQHQ